MSDLVVIDGDLAMFMPSFGAAVVIVRPGPITGSGPATITGHAACLEGDEDSVSVPGCMYVAPPYVIPGSGTLQIDQLSGDQLTQTVAGGGKKLILKGSQFIAKFTVASPAQQPQVSGPVPDATPSYTGNGQFVTTNATVRAG
jgi:hypothetical protein